MPVAMLVLEFFEHMWIQKHLDILYMNLLLCFHYSIQPYKGVVQNNQEHSHRRNLHPMYIPVLLHMQHILVLKLIYLVFHYELPYKTNYPVVMPMMLDFFEHTWIQKHLRIL